MALPSRLQSECCLAVVFGASQWPRARGYNPAPEFTESASGFRKYLQAATGLDIPDGQLLNLFDTPETAESQLRTLREFLANHQAARRRTGLPFTDLFVYAVSHGEGTRQNPRDLHLVVQTTEDGYVDGTGLSIRQLAATLAIEARTMRRYVILDCCFSGAALSHFQSRAENASTIVAADFRRSARSATNPEESLLQIIPSTDRQNGMDDSHDLSEEVRDTVRRAGELPKAGTLLLCSSRADDLSLAKANDGRTVFTSSLLRVLASNSQINTSAAYRPPFQPSMLSFSDLRDRAWDIIAAEFGEAAPYPQLYAPSQSPGDLSNLELLPLLQTHVPSKTKVSKGVRRSSLKALLLRRMRDWRVLALLALALLILFVSVTFFNSIITSLEYKSVSPAGPAPQPSSATDTPFGTLPSHVMRFGFDNVSGDDGAEFKGLTEGGLTVRPTSSNWLIGRTYGSPAPYIYFLEKNNSSQSGKLTITADGGDFMFRSIDIYSSMTRVEYLIVGIRNGTEVFRKAAQVGNTFGNFATIEGPASGASINVLEVEVRTVLGSNPNGLQNPVGVDNIDVILPRSLQRK